MIAGRVLLLCAAGFAVVSGFVLAREREGASARSVDLWICPMDPAVRSKAPGECPICGMALERALRGARVPSNPEPRHGSVDRVESRLFADRVRAPAWVGADGTVTAALYKDDLSRLGPGERGTFFRTAAPAEGLAVRLASGSPIPWDDSTSKARFLPEAGAFPCPAKATDASPAVRCGDMGWLELHPPPKELLVVPWSAVLHSGDGTHVLVPADDGLSFSKRPVEVGRTLYARTVDGRLPPEWIVILSGLGGDERVVVGDTFVSDAERRLSVAREKAEGLAR